MASVIFGSTRYVIIRDCSSSLFRYSAISSSPPLPPFTALRCLSSSSALRSSFSTSSSSPSSSSSSTSTVPPPQRTTGQNQTIVQRSSAAGYHRNCSPSPTPLLSSPISPLTTISRSFSLSTVSLDYYRILGVPKNATPKQIKKAFYQLSLIYHPDRQVKKTKMHRANMYNASVSLDDYQRISVAYSVLIDPERRQAYDERRTRAQSFFDQLRDDWEERWYRMQYRRRFGKEGEGEGEHSNADQEWEAEEERKRLKKERDPHALQLLLGSRKLFTFSLCAGGAFLYYLYHGRIVKGNLMR